MTDRCKTMSNNVLVSMLDLIASLIIETDHTYIHPIFTNHFSNHKTPINWGNKVGIVPDTVYKKYFSFDL